MNRIKQSRFVNFSSMVLALLTTMLLMWGDASAKERKSKGPTTRPMW